MGTELLVSAMKEIQNGDIQNIKLNTPKILLS